MNIEIEKKDICLIGHTAYNCNGNLAIISDIKDCHIEYILLRNALKCFGEYSIVDTYEKFADEKSLLSVTDRVFVTNLPFSIYSSINFRY